jgi:FtsP/CotA-like multicopper oxidase with cupredoxin domain
MFTRRELLKLGLLSGGYTLFVSGPGPRRVYGDDNLLPASPQTTPFLRPLPIPPSPPETASFTPDPACAQFVDPFKTHFFKLVEQEDSVSLHPQLPDTVVWHYRPDISNAPWPFALGPTFKARIANAVGEGVIVRMRNNLPANHVGFGVPHTTTHLHGGHHPSHSDGFPDDISGFPNFVITPEGEAHGPHSYDYCYPLLDPGFFTQPRDATERPSTLWYHDHLFDFTGPNVVKGLAGFFLVFDDLDTGNETTGLQLPSGDFDIPLVLQDRRIGPDGQFRYDPLAEHEGFLGDKFLVNGAIQPFLEVKKRRYRFRFLNGSNARFYRIFLTNASGQAFPMDQIATEGGLLAAPIRGITSFEIGPAERVEVVVDFASLPATASTFFFENRLQQTEGAQPGDVLSRGTQLLQLIVGEAAPGPGPVPSVLRPFAAISQAELASARRKTFEFDQSDGWVINGRLADLEHPLTTSVRGQGEIWHLDAGSGWVHPVHLHLEFMRVLRRNGDLPPLNERDGVARKDTVNIGAGFGNVDVFVKFRDYPGPFVFHCHNIEHEDMRMMARMDIQ